jgi:hypothetical protein
MTPKEKAIELVEKYAVWSWNETVCNYEVAIECALIAVDEVLNVFPQSEYLEDRGEYCENRERLYWNEVKKEIELLKKKKNYD